MRNGELGDLESLASQVLDKFPMIEDTIRIAKRPFYIEFAGAPKSGKTTAAARLDLFLRRNGFKARILTERASTCPLSKKDHMFFNTWTACTTLVQMLESMDRYEQIVIIDRGMFDALCWMQWLEKTGRISSKEKKVIDDFILLSRWREITDIVFIFKVDPKQALEREHAGQLTRKVGSIMNPITLGQFNESIDVVHRNRSELFKKIEVVDTTSLDQLATVKQIALTSLNTLTLFLGEQLLVISKSNFNSIGLEGGFNDDREKMAQLMRLIADHKEFQDRARVETDLNYVQPIPIAYFKFGDKFLLLRRKEDSKKDRMHEKYVIWAGGHIRAQDSPNGDPVSTCLKREIEEELYIKGLPEPELMGVVYEQTNVRSSRHLGIVYRFTLTNPDVVLSMDQKEFKESKGKSVSGSWQTGQELEKYFDKMENWSKFLCVQHLKLFDKPIPHQNSLF